MIIADLLKLANFPAETVKIGEDYGFGHPTVLQLHPEIGFRVVVDGDRNNWRFWLDKFLLKPSVVGPEDHKTTTLGSDSTRNMRKLKEQRDSWCRHFCEILIDE